MAEFVTFDVQGRRWWVLRNAAGAVSLTAIPLPELVNAITPIRDADGDPLMPDCITIHEPGETECPALPGGCDSQGEALRGSREILTEWARRGHDDAYIRGQLEAFHDRFEVE